VCTILNEIYELLQAPDPDDALMSEICDQYRLDRAKHDETARQWTALYANSDPDNPDAVQIPEAVPPRAEE
jgi:hypothetical protein